MNLVGKYLDVWIDFLLFLAALYLLFEGFSGLAECRQLLVQELSTEQITIIVPEEIEERMTENEGCGNHSGLVDCNDTLGGNPDGTGLE